MGGSRQRPKGATTLQGASGVSFSLTPDSDAGSMGSYPLDGSSVSAANVVATPEESNGSADSDYASSEPLVDTDEDEVEAAAVVATVAVDDAVPVSAGGVGFAPLS